MSIDVSIREKLILREKRQGGIDEGLARGLSQMCVYCLETQKTIMQVNGKQMAQALPLPKLVRLLTKGMLESVCTSSLVYGAYFSIYNSFNGHFLAGPVAALGTSLMKVPISNSMRILQAGAAPTFIGAGKKIMRAKGVKGLYSGFPVSLLEDTLELDFRTRLYLLLKNTLPLDLAHNPTVSLAIGCFCGMTAAWITTPCDTVRTMLAVHSKNTGSKVTSMDAARLILRSGGIKGLYRGGTLRATSNGLKSAIFFMILEILQRPSGRKENKSVVYTKNPDDI